MCHPVEILVPVTRRWQAVIGVGLLAAGVLCAYAGSLGADRGIDWLADGAAFPAGLLFALAVAFVLRAVLVGRLRSLTYLRSSESADEAAPERTLELPEVDERR
jgi:hypothetical protein